METIKSLTKEVAAASGSKKAQLVLKNARIVNVFTQSVDFPLNQFLEITLAVVEETLVL